MGQETPPTEEVAAWLAGIYGAVDGGWLSMFALDRASGERIVEWAPATEPETAAETITALAERCCVWCGVATRTERTGSRRGGAAECAQLPALVVDIDIAGEAHASDRLSSDEDQAHRVLERFPLAPTATVQTGNGLQAWWVLTEPVDAADAEGLLGAWGATWADIGTQCGVVVDNVFDLARVMRVPGTLNTKTEPPRPVRVLEADWARTYGADGIGDHLIEAPQPVETGRTKVPYIGPERPGDAFNAIRTGGDVLAAAGFHSPKTSSDGSQHWVRPGKDARDGHSATVHSDGHTSIWSETCTRRWPTLTLRRPYDPFGLWTHIFAGGNFTAAADTLEGRGYGSRAMADDRLGAWLDELAAAPEPNGDWPELIPLDAAAGDVPAFPLDALSDWMAAAVTDVCERLQVPVDLGAMLAIGAASTVTATKVVVEVAPTWQETTNLYLAVALPPGAGKSPVYRRLVGPVHDLELALRERAQAEIVAAEQMAEVLTKRLTNAKNAAAKAEDVFDAIGAVERATRDMLDHEVPVAPRLIADDATPEKLAELAAGQGGRMAVLGTEGDVFDLMTGRYGDRPNLGIYLRGWSGDALKVDRIGRDSLDIAEVTLTLCVTVQPDVLASMAEHPELAGRGLSSRVMYALPVSMLGRRDRRRSLDAGVSIAEGRYGEELTALGEACRSWQHPLRLRVDPPARERFGDWDQGIEDGLDGGELAHMSEWIAKLRASVLRLAGILTVCDDLEERTITDETMVRALAVGDYWLAHARVVHDDIWGTDPEMGAARLILDWVTGEGLARFSQRDLYRAHRRRFPRADTTVAPLRLLTERGHLRIVEGELREGRSNYRSPIFEVRPAEKASSARVARVVPRDTKKAHSHSFSKSERRPENERENETPGTTRATRAELEEPETPSPHSVQAPGWLLAEDTQEQPDA